MTSNPPNHMEVEDLFCSPTTTESISEWKETIITELNDCDKVKCVCPLASCMAILAVKEENVIVLVYSLPEYNLKLVLDLKKYGSQEAVLSSCVVSFMSPRLKQCFKGNLETFDEEIIVIGLVSGLVLWISASSPLRGPFVLFYAYQKVQSIHWIKDSNSGQYTHLLILLTSGQIIVFGEEKHSTLYLPDSVKASFCLQNFIVTSNFVDCYSSKIQMDTNLSIVCVSLPVKGICAMSNAPGSDTLLITATLHGSVYCFNPTIAPPGNTSMFTLPDQSLLDNMFLQSENLESIYKKLQKEEEILKAVSATIAANCGADLFQTTINVVSDGVFSVTAKIIESKVVFLSELWSVCVEVIKVCDSKEISFHKIEQDFTSSSDLTMNVSHSLSVGDVVSIELVYFIEHQQPLLIVPVGKVEIDACYLMCSQMMSGSTSKTEETLENILDDMKKEPSKLILSECKLIVKLPDDCPGNSLFKVLLTSSQQRFSFDEWDKLSSGRKFNVSVCICSFAVLLNLDMDSRELIITSSNTKLCHQVKEAIIKRLKCTVKKSIPESLTLNIQAIHQTFEIESLKEESSIETLDSLRKNLRASVSAQLAL